MRKYTPEDHAALAEAKQLVNGSPRLMAILDDVSHVYRVGKLDIMGHSRFRSIVEARMAFYWVAKKLTIRGYLYIGRFLGDRDHTTIMHGIKCVNRDMDKHAARLRMVVRRLQVEMPEELQR